MWFYSILQWLILRNISFLQGTRHSHLTCQSRASISFALILWRTTWRAISCNTIGFARQLQQTLTVTNLASDSFAHWLTFAVSALLKAKGWWPDVKRKVMEGQSCWASRMPRLFSGLSNTVLRAPSLPPVHSTKETTPMLHTSQRSSYLPKRTCSIVQSRSFCARPTFYDVLCMQQTCTMWIMCYDCSAADQLRPSSGAT